MSDAEEPPTKMSKYEEYLEEGEEGLEEGQEEWLSEGVLTDDDYHANASAELVKTESTVEDKTQDEQESQDTMLSIQEMVDAADKSQDTEKEKADQHMEDTLNNLDGKNGLAEESDSFHAGKTDGSQSETKDQNSKDSKTKEDDDGNDTDDLLVNNSWKRLLEDDQQVKKKAIKIIKSEKNEDPGSSDDDEFVYERSKVKTLKIAKNALIKRVATKAKPEAMSDTDDESSSDERIVKRMFAVKSASSKPVNKHNDSNRKVVKHVQVNSNHYKPKPNFPQNIVKHTTPKQKTEPKPFKPEVKTVTNKLTEKNVAKLQNMIKAERKDAEERKKREAFDEIIDGEEFLEEEEFELDEEEFTQESETGNSKKQRIMKPEMMDEEVPSDEESHTEDGSLYDELPSSDSEDFDDWFTLDIRSERATDYLPLLGSCARSLLTEERRRCLSRVATLRHSLSALTDSARRQADTLRHASMALAEIDDTLRAV